MKFKFPLQKVLDHRKTKENLAQKDFQDAMADLVALEKQLEKLQEALHNSHGRAGRLQNQGGSQGPALTQINDFQKLQKILIERQHVKIQQQSKIVEEKRELLKAATIETKIISKFKEKKFEEFRDAQGKEEQKEMDEQSILRFKPVARREG